LEILNLKNAILRFKISKDFKPEPYGGQLEKGLHLRGRGTDWEVL